MQDCSKCNTVNKALLIHTNYDSTGKCSTSLCTLGYLKQQVNGEMNVFGV